MKIKIFAFLSVLLIAVCPSHAQTTIPHPYIGVNSNQTFATPMDSIVEKLLAHQKQIRSKKSVISNGQIVVDVNQNWNDTGWVNSSRDITIYDANGYDTNDLEQTWNDTGWINSYRYSLTYDASGHDTSEWVQTWIGSG